MKRITYISRLTKPLSDEEIKRIGIISGQNNKAVNITGLLVYFEKLFFQIIEGRKETVDELFRKIRNDPRHHDILRLKTEDDVDQRLFPTWSMKAINLDNNVDELVYPIKVLLQTVTLSHAIIEQYTQPAILKIINNGRNPLNITPKKVKKIILFTDIVSYSAISERMSIDEVFLILNTYFDVCSKIIIGKGGEVNKFLGDGLLAYFDVEQADDSIQACLDIIKELKNLRQNSPVHSPLRLLNSGFGLAQGVVIEGNMGSSFKTDYTIIGDAVNIASRLEELTREVNSSIVLSESLKDCTTRPWTFISLGKFSLKGKAEDTEIYTIDHELVNNLLPAVHL